MRRYKRRKLVNGKTALNFEKDVGIQKLMKSTKIKQILFKP
jgi:hypothetical protein